MSESVVTNEVELTLADEEVRMILDVLSQLPYRQSAPLISRIGYQLSTKAASTTEQEG